MTDKLKYLLHLADNGLILGQRLGEWCGHGPVLEQDIALTNIALDLIGQSRLYFQYAATLDEAGRNEDQLAFTRTELEYYNLLLCEHHNIDFAYTIARQYFFDYYHLLQHESLAGCKDTQISAIAQKSIKEIRYHYKYSSEWMLRLGDGTDESHAKMQVAVNALWEFTGELFVPAVYESAMQDEGIAPDLQTLKANWEETVVPHLATAGLQPPETPWMKEGGKTGHHTEAMGYLLSDLQYMQRAYPDMEW